MNDSYQESYQSWEIVDYEEFPNGGWPESRRCGYIFYSWYYTLQGRWFWTTAASGGKSTVFNDFYGETRCNCPTKYGSYITDTNSCHDVYTAVCQYRDWIGASSYHDGWNNAASANWVRTHTCPKGWGRYPGAGTDKPYVQCAQGHVTSGYQEPIYGYVTRYRDVYYDYLSTRVAKS